jgi:PadR family transcriptional regulator PadR
MLCVLLYICQMNETFVTNWKSQVKKGTLTYIILNILKENEYYGYELIEQIKKHTEIEIAEGTLYPLLNRLKTENLVDSKWVEQETGIPRKYYCLTEMGIKTLIPMNDYWKNLENSIQKIIK